MDDGSKGYGAKDGIFLNHADRAKNMPYASKEQLAKLNDLKCKQAALQEITRRFLDEQMVAEIGLQKENRDLWMAIAEEHKMDLAKYEYRIDFKTGEIECKGELEDE